MCVCVWQLENDSILNKTLKKKSVQLTEPPGLSMTVFAWPSLARGVSAWHLARVHLCPSWEGSPARVQ